MAQLTANQVECLDDAEDRLSHAYGALTAFNAALKTATEYKVLPQDLYAFLFPIQGEMLAALNDIQTLHGK
jgi:hypothetical protein